MSDDVTPSAQTEKRSNTADEQRKPGKPFVKGDKRINRKGRPKTFDKLRAMVQETLNGDLKIKKPTGETVETTRLRLMLESMTTGGNPADHRLLLEYGFGKVKEEVDITHTWKERAREAGYDPEEIERQARSAVAGIVAGSDSGDAPESGDGGKQ